MSSLKKLAGDTALYGISSILGRALNFLLVPLYTSVFAVGEYGIVGTLYAYVAFFNVLYTYGMETAYFRFANRQREQEQLAYNTSFTSILITSLLLSGILFLLAPTLLEWLNYQRLPVSYIYWLAIIIALDAIVAIPFARLRLQNRPILFASARLINIFLNIGLNLFFLVLCPAILRGEWPMLSSLQPLVERIYDPGLGVGYVFLSNLIANSLYLPLLLPVLLKVRLQLYKPMWKEMLLYSYPLLLMGIAGVTNQMLSIPLLQHWLPDNFYEAYNKEAAVGIFIGCYKLSIFMNLAIQAFRFAAEPFFFSKASDKNSPALFSQVMHYFILVCCLILFAVTVNLPWLVPLLLRDTIYLEGLEIVPILLLGYLFYGVYLNLSIWFKLSDKTGWGTWFTSIGAVLTIVLNLLLIPLLGYMGAALSSLLVYFSIMAMCYYYGQKFYPIPYRTLSGLLYIGGTVMLAYALRLLMPEATWPAVAAGIGATLLYILAIGLYEMKRLRTSPSPF
ncbi:lipopolysaccharide biosynthesis protein [Cesiribacter andamanensis]|uniref:Polysaccharide biosynthesis protein n=1 Tax=Cesiribacter andamanensis AMV16 TaxID=1279009 RepID=M7NS58_9BACT|nr:polysaccharide biosynthesis C-terminal domain-containing protein [Cesiribacter andamanensis]EMR04535.1 Polysaccharide biosynthesis protein [Cesiribacter andamanensis AMV16]